MLKSVNLVYMCPLFFTLHPPTLSQKDGLVVVLQQIKEKPLVNNQSIHIYLKFFGCNFFLFRGCYYLKLWVKKNRFITQWSNIVVQT